MAVFSSELGDHEPCPPLPVPWQQVTCSPPRSMLPGQDPHPAAPPCTHPTQAGWFQQLLPTLHPPSRAWGRVLPGGLTPSPGTGDAACTLVPSLCRQLCRGASATSGSLIIDGQVSRQGGCSSAGLCLPSTDNPGPGTAGCSRRDIGRLGGTGLRSASLSSWEGARCCTGTPLLPQAALLCPAPRAGDTPRDTLLPWALCHGRQPATGFDLWPGLRRGDEEQEDATFPPSAQPCRDKTGNVMFIINSCLFTPKKKKSGEQRAREHL